jgi:hypothetical protein
VGAASAAGVLDAEADGGVSSIASMTVIILRLFSAGFLIAAGSSFYKSFINCGPSGLSLRGKYSVITFKISSTSALGGVEGTSSSITVVLGFVATTSSSISGLDFSFLKLSHLLLSF